MALRCPVCGRTFPDGAKHCDQDGAPLVVAAPRAPSRKPLPAAAAVVGALALVFVTAPVWLKAYIRSTLSMDFAGIQFPTVTATRDMKLRLGAERLRLSAQVRNGSAVPVVLSGIEYSILVNNTKVYESKIAQEVTIPARSVVQQEFDGGVHAGKEFSWNPGMSPEAGVQLRITATASALHLRDAVNVIASAKLKLQLPGS